MVHWNGAGCIQPPFSQTQLVSSYFAKEQLCWLNFILRNRTWVNSYRLLLSSLVRLISIFGSIALLSWSGISIHAPVNFISHVTAAVWLQQQSACSKKKKKCEEKRKANQIWKREKKHKNGKTPALVAHSWWGKEQNVLLHMSRPCHGRGALAIISRRWMHNLQVGGKPWKVHSAWTLHQDFAGKEGPKPNYWRPTCEVTYTTADRQNGSALLNSTCPC